MVARNARKLNMSPLTSMDRGWISVEDRLPDDDSDALVFDGHDIGIGYRVQDIWYELCPWGKTPTHWMPLPEPPQ